MSVRVESTGVIAHADVSGGITACGILYSTEVVPWPAVYRIIGGVESTDPVDCMNCLVQETRDAADRITVSFTVELPRPITMTTYILEFDP